MPRAKIAILYVGGSIGMKTNQATGRLDPIESIDEIYQFLPELQKEVSLDFYSISTVGSSDITPTHWQEISTKIVSLYEKYSGFVVIHGTNTMAFTASAIAFSLQNLSKPIVFTGALLPLNDLAGDGRMNLIHAIRAAQLDIAEVCIVMGARVLRAVRARKVDQHMFRTFHSPNFPSLADFSDTESPHEWRIVRRKRTLEHSPTFESNILVLPLFPGLTEQILYSVLSAKPKGIIIQAYGPGMLPESLNTWLQDVTNLSIPIVITSQTLKGGVNLHKYRKQLLLENLGVISGKNMSHECAVAKFMWALANKKGHKAIRSFMEKSVLGELDE